MQVFAILGLNEFFLKKIIQFLLKIMLFLFCGWVVKKNFSV